MENSRQNYADLSYSDDEAQSLEDLDGDQANRKRLKTTSSEVSVASSTFGHKPDEKNEVCEKIEGAKRGPASEWVIEAEFPSSVVFMDSPQYQDLMDNFNTDSKKTNKQEDIIRTWVCKFSKKKKGFACQVKSRTVHSHEKVTVSRLGGVSHDHDRTEDSDRKHFNFPPEVEAKIQELVELNVNSRQIRKSLLDKGLFTEETAPPDKVLYNKTWQIRQKLNKTRSNIGLRDLEDLIENSSKVPEDRNEPYVVKHSVGEDPDGRLRYSIMFASKHLIEKFMKPGEDWVLSVDSTYQTNTEDCPLMFFGSSTREGKFNGIGAVLSNREDKEAFDFLFDFVKQTSEPVPISVMADADKAITSSLRDKLPQCKRLTCFFHVMKNVRQRLSRVKAIDKSVYNQLMDDIRVLQSSSVDEKSFLILYGMFKKKWMTEHVFYDPELKIMVSEFLDYFDKVWINSEERFWFQAANPQHITSNNGVEGTNQSFKKHFTGRTRLSFPHMFSILKELLVQWSRQNKDFTFDPSKVPKKTISQAEELLEKCHKDEKAKTLLLSKKTKGSHRTLIKHDSGVVRGFVVESTIFPLKEELFASQQKEFAALGQDIHARRNNIGYDNFDQFKSDSKSVAFVETVFKEENRMGASFFSCSCCFMKSDSGVKEKICCHVVVAMMEAGVIKKRSANTRISNFDHKKGAAKKNRKQNN